MSDETAAKQVEFEAFTVNTVQYDNKFCTINKEGTETEVHKVRRGLIACAVK
jgi:hypothetical protein